MNVKSNKKAPLILAPAGNRDAFLAAVSAKADAVYCGLKQYSARMEAKNFTVEELCKLTDLAHEKDVKVYLALNSMLKSDEVKSFAVSLKQAVEYIMPDAFIVQDLAVVRLARELGYSGQIHLSTLANISFPGALEMVRKHLTVDRVVIPRELTIDEIKRMGDACPKGLSLEVFVHGALCYGVSGRCYWSSYLGGKSGLRGQCVQPCRRFYQQQDHKEKYFSCQDLSMDVLTKVLLNIPKISGWKIEGRKKSPHYVYYTTTAYRMLRDEGNDPKIKKSAMELLQRALGRTGTHYFFLPQRPYNPIDTKRQTGSGLFVGKISNDGQKSVLIPREELLPKDVLRAGYEDEKGYGLFKVKKFVPKKGRYYLNTSGKKKPAKGVPVFLTDRREAALDKALAELNADLEKKAPPRIIETTIKIRHLPRFTPKVPLTDMTVYRRISKGKKEENCGLWLPSTKDKETAHLNMTKTWWWLPPVIWPEEERHYRIKIQQIYRKGGRKFVLNAPWQKSLFNADATIELWAGPFCNIANPAAVDTLKELGFSGVVVSPELSGEEFLKLPAQCSLPLGIVLSGNWPLCVSRIKPPDLTAEFPFISPKKEISWTVYEGNNTWVYPNWKLDIRSHKKKLIKAGYRLFIHLSEPVPKSVDVKKRPGNWNWGLTLR